MSENPTNNASSERYRFNQQIVRVAVGNNQELLHCDLTGATKLVPKNEVRILQACRKFATLDEHAGGVCSELGLGPLHLAAVRQQLTKFAEAGLVVPHSLLHDWCRRRTTCGTTSKISYFGVLTRNRPQFLKQCLESYAQCARQNGKRVTFLVADQSDGEHCTTNAEAIDAVKSEFGIEIRHITPQSVELIANRLSEISGVPPALVTFALNGNHNGLFAGGANRNLLLLSSVGGLILQSDDDSVCRVMQPPGMQAGLALTSALDPAEFWFPTAVEMSKMEQELKTEDMFALHERFLGKSVEQCVRESDGPVDIDSTTASFYWRLNNEESRIIATNSGLVGESGRGEGQPIIVLDGNKRSRLIQSEQHYRYVQKTQRLLRGVTRPTITEGAVCFGFNLGLDNREIVPPFMPIFRGEDSMFTAVFRAATTNGFFTILPWLAYHAGAGEKKRADKIEAHKVARLTFCDIISLILQSYQARTFETATNLRLRAMRDLLVEIGSLAPTEFERVMRTIWWQVASLQISKLETALKLHSNKPEFWSKDIADYIEEYRNSFVNPRSIVAADVSAAFGEAAAFDKQQELIRQYGELLGAWCDLREAAATLHQRQQYFGVASDN